jgi:hypothetical protein
MMRDIGLILFQQRHAAGLSSCRSAYHMANHE